MKTAKLKATDLEAKKRKDLMRAKAFYAACPFTTRVYMALKTKLPISFLVANWEEISK